MEFEIVDKSNRRYRRGKLTPLVEAVINGETLLVKEATPKNLMALRMSLRRRDYALRARLQPGGGYVIWAQKWSERS